jgi:YidC/Oxa1 family membrane protein insertase
VLGSVLGLVAVALATLPDLPRPVPGISIPIWDQYVDGLKYVLNDVLAETLKNGALAIIVFTIGIKTLLLPLTVKATRSSKAMQELQPKIAELRKKYGKDRQEMSVRTMELYRQYNVNPMAGCLPMLIQIPIFFGVYSAINSLSNSHVGYWTEGFLWIPDLGDPDPWKILPFVAAGFQFVQTKMMRPANQGKITDPQQAMMNTMMNFMPLMVIFFGWNFAAGAVLYWAIQSVYSVVQQWFITGWGSLKDWLPGLWEMPEHRRLGYRKPADLDAVVVVSGERPQQKGFSGWMQRKMEESQRLADERRKAQQAARAANEPERPTSSRKTNGAASGASSAAPARTDWRNRKPGGTSSYQATVDETAADGADVAPRASTNAKSGKRAGGRASRPTSAKATNQKTGKTTSANGSAPLPAPRKDRPGQTPSDGGAG